MTLIGIYDVVLRYDVGSVYSNGRYDVLFLNFSKLQNWNLEMSSYQKF